MPLGCGFCPFTWENKAASEYFQKIYSLKSHKQYELERGMRYYIWRAGILKAVLKDYWKNDKTNKQKMCKRNMGGKQKTSISLWKSKNAEVTVHCTFIIINIHYVSFTKKQPQSRNSKKQTLEQCLPLLTEHGITSNYWLYSIRVWTAEIERFIHCNQLLKPAYNIEVNITSNHSWQNASM